MTVPGSAPRHPHAAIAAEPGAAIDWRAGVTESPTISGPFPGVSQYVEQAKCIGPITTDRRGEGVPIIATGQAVDALLTQKRSVAKVGKCAAIIDMLAPVSRAANAGTRRVLSLCFRWQTIGIAGLGGEPRRISQGVIPGNADDRMIVCLRKTRASPASCGIMHPAPVLPMCATGRDAPGFGLKSGELRASDFESAHCKCSCYGD